MVGQTTPVHMAGKGLIASQGLGSAPVGVDVGLLSKIATLQCLLSKGWQDVA